MEGFRQVVVGAGFQPDDDVFFVSARGQQDDIDVRLVDTFAHAAANADAIETRHHPIEKREARSVLTLQHGPGFGAVCGHDCVVTPLFEVAFDQLPRNGVVFGNQNLHRTIS